jgi:hypothetical protein
LITYRCGYKYQLSKDYHLSVDIYPLRLVATDWLELSVQGSLLIRKGYAWDGPTVAIDTKTFMRASLVHDALYQLMREGFLLEERWRKTADETMYKICLEDGMNWFRAWYAYTCVRIFSGGLSDPAYNHIQQTAP